MRWIFCLLFSISLVAKPLDVKVTARSAILMNADTGAVLYEKHPHVPSYPASTTKVATLLFTLEQKQPDYDRMVTVSAEAVRIKPVGTPGEYPPYWNEIDGTKMGILRGEILSFNSLLHGLMLVSGNDAANVIAENLSTSIPDFIFEMNQYLKEIGCLNTQFQNPHGIHHPEHYTTAYDLALITKRALKIPKFREIVSSLSYMKPKSNKQPAVELRQFNQLIKPGKYYYPKAIGVKTGYHSHAENALVAAAEHEGRTLIAVLLGCPKRTDRYSDAIHLFDAAFDEELQMRRLLGTEQKFQLEVEGAQAPIVASLSSDLTISYYPAEEPQAKAFVHWDAIHLPVRKGQKVGEVRIKGDKDEIIKKGDLLAKEEVKGTFFFGLKEWVSHLFR